MPRTSPLFTAPGGNAPAAPPVLDAVATAPALERATFVCCVGPPPPPPGSHASISTRRETPPNAPVMLTRIRSVVVCANVTVRFTRLLPVTLPTTTHADPFHVSTVNAVRPYVVKVVASVGSTPPPAASCNEYTTT